MEEKKKGDPYTIEFIERKGGVEEVARKAGINRQTVRQVATGRNAPSYDFITMMISAYTDYDIRSSIRPKTLALAGEDYTSYEETEEQGKPKASSEAILIAELRDRIASLEKSNSMLLTAVSKQLGIDIESGKNESAIDVTQDGQFVLPFGSYQRVKRSLVPLIMRDARAISRTWKAGN